MLTTRGFYVRAGSASSRRRLLSRSSARRSSRPSSGSATSTSHLSAPYLLPSSGGPRPSSSCSLGRPVATTTRSRRGSACGAVMSLAQSLRHVAGTSAADECCSWDDLAPSISQRVIDRLDMPATQFGSTCSQPMGAATRPIAATSSATSSAGLRVPLAGGAERPGVIGRDLSVPRHDHRPITGRWRWEELEMRIAKDTSKQQLLQENEVYPAFHQQGGAGLSAASASSSSRRRRKGALTSRMQTGTSLGPGRAGQQRINSASSHGSKGMRDSSRPWRSSYDATVERLFEHTSKTHGLLVPGS
jgi:hypothetical protein